MPTKTAYITISYIITISPFHMYDLAVFSVGLCSGHTSHCCLDDERLRMCNITSVVRISQSNKLTGNKM